jgi:hypothetical protein
MLLRTSCCDTFEVLRNPYIADLHSLSLLYELLANSLDAVTTQDRSTDGGGIMWGHPNTANRFILLANRRDASPSPVPNVRPATATVACCDNFL